MGKSRFCGNQHIFQNLGEGTYFHSGYMAVRQAVAAKTNITYKILFNAVELPVHLSFGHRTGPKTQD